MEHGYSKFHVYPTIFGAQFCKNVKIDKFHLAALVSPLALTEYVVFELENLTDSKGCKHLVTIPLV